MLKRFAALFLVVLMSIESFAAIVGDNDGAAFITKAEFDSLKNEFQTQIDRYNASIDNKIDGAIAGYLEGIKISKKTDIKVKVANYNDIMWFNDWKIYGKYTRWSARTTMSDNKSGSLFWYTPSAAEKRANLTRRSSVIDVYDIWSSGGYGNLFILLRGSVSSFSGAGTYAPDWGITYCSSQGGPTIPILVCNMEYDETYGMYKMYTSKPLVNVEGYLPYMWTYPHSVAKTHDYVSGGRSYDTMDYTELQYWGVNTPGAAEYFKYYIRLKGYDSIISQNTDADFQSTLNQSNAAWPTVGYFSEMDDSDFATWATTCAEPFGTSNTNYYTNGCTWHYMDSSSKANQFSSLINMFLGNNNSQQINCLKPLLGNIAGKISYDMTGSPGSASVSLSFNTQRLANLQTDYQVGRYKQWTSAKTGTIQLPYWPIDYLKNITSAKYLYNEKPLKIGQGLPILEETLEKGDLQMEFDYDIKYLLNSTSYKTSQDLYIDVKNKDYLVSNDDSDYLDGYLGLIDSDKTDETPHKLKQYKYPEKTGKVKLTIPVDKGQALWLRMRASNTTGGYYVKISNMKMTYVTQ